jgi:hypothetical protein
VTCSDQRIEGLVVAKADCCCIEQFLPVQVYVDLCVCLPPLLPQKLVSLASLAWNPEMGFSCRFNPETGLGFACGGSGSLFKSTDSGKSWKRDRSTDSIAGNLYAVEFDGKNGFILGNDGILLRYIG